MAIEKTLAAKTPEKLIPHTPETEKTGLPESMAEKKPIVPEKGSPKDKRPQAQSTATAPVIPAVSYQEKRAQEIDQILEDGLNEIFLSLPENERQDFKKKGEETVTKINQLLSKTKVHLNKIIALIRDWLQLIPGVNRFFLEQEAKIKAAKIIKIKDKF